MPRLFTGLELPQTVVGQIARGRVFGARLEPEDYHVTLRFVGDVDATAQILPCSRANVPCSAKRNALFSGRERRSLDRLNGSPRRAGATSAPIGAPSRRVCSPAAVVENFFAEGIFCAMFVPRGGRARFADSSA